VCFTFIDTITQTSNLIGGLLVKTEMPQENQCLGKNNINTYMMVNISTSLVATMVRHVERKAISPGTKKSPAQPKLP
jgi:hypothetical protein